MFSSFMVKRIHRSVGRHHIKDVVLIAHRAVFHHSLSVIYWSKYSKAILSNDISTLICLPFCPAVLYLFGPGADPAARLWKRSALSLHLKWRIEPLPRASIFQLKRKADVILRGCVCMFVRDRTCRWQCPLPGPRPSFSLRSVGSDGSVFIIVQIWILLTPPSEAGVSNAASCACWNSQPSLSNCWDGAAPKPKLITLNEQKL